MTKNIINNIAFDNSTKNLQYFDHGIWFNQNIPPRGGSTTEKCKFEFQPSLGFVVTISCVVVSSISQNTVITRLPISPYRYIE